MVLDIFVNENIYYVSYRTSSATTNYYSHSADGLTAADIGLRTPHAKTNTNILKDTIFCENYSMFCTYNLQSFQQIYKLAKCSQHKTLQLKSEYFLYYLTYEHLH